MHLLQFWSNVLYEKGWVLYILTSVWVLGTPKAGQNLLFHIFACFFAHFHKILKQNCLKMGSVYFKYLLRFWLPAKVIGQTAKQPNIKLRSTSTPDAAANLVKREYNLQKNFKNNFRIWKLVFTLFLGCLTKTFVDPCSGMSSFKDHFHLIF